jgi:hypothetical protein
MSPITSPVGATAPSPDSPKKSEVNTLGASAPPSAVPGTGPSSRPVDEKPPVSAPSASGAAPHTFGKPDLPAVNEDHFDITASEFMDDIAMTIVTLFGLNNQVVSGAACVNTMTKQEQETNKKKAIEYKERQEKLIKEEKEGGFMKVLKIIGQAFATLGAIIGAYFACVAAVASSGLATPLVAAAIIGVIFALESLINVILSACDKPPISFVGLLTQAFTELYKAFGVPEEIAKMMTAVFMAAAAVVALVLCPATLDVAMQAFTQMAQTIVEKVCDPEMASKLMIAISVCAAVICVAGGYMNAKNMSKEMKNVEKKIGDGIAANFLKATGKEMSPKALQKAIDDGVGAIQGFIGKNSTYIQLGTSLSSGVLKTTGGAWKLKLAEIQLGLAEIKCNVQKLKMESESLTADIGELNQWISELLKQCSSLTESCIDSLMQHINAQKECGKNIA